MSIQPLRVLVADDEVTARLLRKAALGEAGFAVSLAADGAEALRQFQAEPCAMVMLDVEECRSRHPHGESPCCCGASSTHEAWMT